MLQKKRHIRSGAILVLFLFNGLVSIAHAEVKETVSEPSVSTEKMLFKSTMSGMGRVPDLRNALELSPELREIHQSFMNVETNTERKVLLIDLLRTWAYADPTRVVEPTDDMKDKQDVNVYGTGPVHGVSEKGYRYFEQAKHDVNSKNIYVQTKSGLKKVEGSSSSRIKSVGKDWKEPPVKITIPEDLIKKVEIINAFADIDPRVFYYLDTPHMKEITAQIEKTYDRLAQQLYYQLLADIRMNSK